MISQEPVISDNAKLSTKEVAELLKVSVWTIQRATNSGLIKCGNRRSNGRRFYKGSDIKRYWHNN